VSHLDDSFTERPKFGCHQLVESPDHLSTPLLQKLHEKGVGASAGVSHTVPVLAQTQCQCSLTPNAAREPQGQECDERTPPALIPAEPQPLWAGAPRLVSTTSLLCRGMVGTTSECEDAFESGMGEEGVQHCHASSASSATCIESKQCNNVMQHRHASQAVQHANSATRLTPHATNLLLESTIMRVSYVLSKAGKGWDILEVPQEDATLETLGNLPTTPPTPVTPVPSQCILAHGPCRARQRQRWAQQTKTTQGKRQLKPKRQLPPQEARGVSGPCWRQTCPGLGAVRASPPAHPGSRPGPATSTAQWWHGAPRRQGHRPRVHCNASITCILMQRVCAVSCNASIICHAPPGSGR
jgi:hypothetical protein